MNFRIHLPVLCLALLTLFSCRTEPREEVPVVDFKRTENVVAVRLPAEPAKLNPLLYRSGYESQVFEHLFQYLMNFSYDDRSELVPVLVTDRPKQTPITDGPNAGGTRFEFELRPEARWDNGEPVTARDVEFTMKAIYNPTMPTQRIRAFLDFFRGIELDPDNPRRFTFITGNPYVLAEEVLSNLVIIPSYIYDPKNILENYTLDQFLGAGAEQLKENDAALQEFTDEFNKPEYSREKLVGSGPYRMKEWQAGQRIVLERKKDWWATDLTGAQFANGPEELVFLPITDNAAMNASLLDEGFDVSSQVDSRTFLDLQENESVAARYNFLTPPTYQTYFMAINTDNPKLSDQRVRRAIAHTIDIEEVIDKLFFGFAEPSHGLIDSKRSYYNKDLPIIGQDIARARELLTAAGWTDTNGNGTVDKVIDGTLTELELSYGTSTGSNYGNKFAQYLQQEAAKAGISVTPAPQDARQLSKSVVSKEYELAGRALNWYPFPHDLRQLLHSEADVVGGYNYTGFGNEESDRILEDIQKTTDKAELDRLYKRLQKLMYDETIMAAVFNPQNRVVIHKRFDAQAVPRAPGYNPARFEIRKPFSDN